LKALTLSNRKTEIGLRISECYVKQELPEKAIKELKNLIRDFPQHLPSRMKLGTVYYNLSMIAEATEQWENVLYRDPTHIEAKKLLKMAQTAGITSLSPNSDEVQL
jgi:tetratricopeptide (TPR) repeat protein